MNSIKEKRKTLAAKKCEPGYKEAGKKGPSLVRSKLKLETGDKKSRVLYFLGLISIVNGLAQFLMPCDSKCLLITQSGLRPSDTT